MNDKQMVEAVERTTSYMSCQTLMQINEEKYGFMRDVWRVVLLQWERNGSSFMSGKD